MIAPLLFTIALLSSAVYIHAQTRLLGLIRIVLYTVIIAGIFLVWSPDQATRIANALGIGRGADLIYYVWIMLSLAVFINIHLKLRENVTLVTQLARQIAIAEAQRELNVTRALASAPASGGTRQ